MNPYERPGWRDQFRPGGQELTRRLAALSGLAPGAAILDVGCGTGESCALLEGLGFEAAGFDRSRTLIDRGLEAHPGLALRVGDMSAPPFAPQSFDALIFECTLSAVDARTALAGCTPLLRQGGIALISDVYARQNSDTLLSRAGWEGLLAEHGLYVTEFEDHSRSLAAFLGQKLMDGLCLEELLCISEEEYRRARAGYCLMRAQRRS